MTNGQAIRQGFVPCETNPETGGLSRTADVFHGRAVATVGLRKGEQRHVCLDCAQRFHKHLHHRPGVQWK